MSVQQVSAKPEVPYWGSYAERKSLGVSSSSIHELTNRLAEDSSPGPRTNRFKGYLEVGGRKRTSILGLDKQ